MMTIIEASINDVHTIQEIAYKSWPDTYGEILSSDQITYMLDLFYKPTVLMDNMIYKKHHFILLNEGNKSIGFASYEHNYLEKNSTRLHKIYLIPEAQGKGAGKLLIETVKNLASQNNSEILSLNVNRFNKAARFYQKLGFVIVGEENIVLEHGYLMEDYKMEMKL